MSRSPSFRLAALLLSGAFLLGSGKAAVAELGCIHHGLAHGEAPVGAHAEPQDGGHGSHGTDAVAHGHRSHDAHPQDGSHDHRAALHDHGASDGPAHDDDRCTCVATCFGGSSTPQAASGSQTVHFTSPSRAAITFGDGAAEPRAPLPYLLPYATAPPASS